MQAEITNTHLKAIRETTEIQNAINCKRLVKRVISLLNSSPQSSSSIGKYLGKLNICAFQKQKKRKLLLIKNTARAEYFPVASSYQPNKSTLCFNTLTSGVCLKKIAKTCIYFSDAESRYHFYKVTH